MMKLEEFRQRLVLNMDALDEELQEQANLYFSAAEEHVRAISRRDAAANEKEQIYAECLSRHRAKLEKDSDGTRVTDSAVKAKADLDPSYLEAVQELSDRKLEADLWGAMKESFSQRGWALREMCEMVRAEVFSVSSIKGGAPGDRLHEANRQAIANKRKLTRKES